MMPDVAELTRKLTDVDPAVRAQAAWDLGNLGPSAVPAADALARALEEEALRSCAGWALVKIGGPAAESLIRALERGTPPVRLAALSALWKLAPERGAIVLKALVKALTDEDEAIRAYAAWSLGEIGRLAAPAIAALVTALTDPAPLVRGRAAAALGRIGEPSDAAILGLADTLGDSSSGVRVATAGALLVLGLTCRSSTLRTALHVLDHAARHGPRSERRLYRGASAAIRANAPPSPPLSQPAAHTLPRPAAAPDHAQTSLPRPSQPTEFPTDVE